MTLAACGGPPESPRGSAPVPSGYKVGKPYQIDGRWYRPFHDPGYDEVGIASWYGQAFHGRPTANGERFDKETVSAAHPTLPLPSLVEVTNLDNGRSLTLRVNDRGPFVSDRLIDLSEAAARELGYRNQGLARVRVRFLQLAERGDLGQEPVRVAAAATVPAATAGDRLAGSAASTACTGLYHYIQVGAFSDTVRAQSIASELSQHGRVQVDHAEANGAPIERVRFGPLPSRGEAFAALADVHRLGYRDAIVVSC